MTDLGALRRRLDAMLRWLVDDGHMNPWAAQQILKILDEERIQDTLGE